MSIKQSIKTGNERGARRQLIEELFQDFHSSRYQVYTFNFVRGIFFGFGTVLGGTVFVAMIVWILSQFIGWFPSIIGDWLHQIIIMLQR
jgi:hypothetical protein